MAGAIGNNIDCKGLVINSLQGDKAITDIISAMGGKISFDGEKMVITSSSANTIGTIIDASDCPDIIPVLSVLASVSEGKTKIITAGRLRLKECDRLRAVTAELNKLGADVTELAEGLVIRGKKYLNGGEVEAWNDHRIAMSLAIASIKCRERVILHGAECVNKSYPQFWRDFVALGGQIEHVES